MIRYRYIHYFRLNLREALFCISIKLEVVKQKFDQIPTSNLSLQITTLHLHAHREFILINLQISTESS